MHKTQHYSDASPKLVMCPYRAQSNELCPGLQTLLKELTSLRLLGTRTPFPSCAHIISKSKGVKTINLYDANQHSILHFPPKGGLLKQIVEQLPPAYKPISLA